MRDLKLLAAIDPKQRRPFCFVLYLPQSSAPTRKRTRVTCNFHSVNGSTVPLEGRLPDSGMSEEIYKDTLNSEKLILTLERFENKC